MATIKFRTRIAQATDEEKSARYALQGTLVTPDGFAVATDGRIAACAKVNVDGLKSPTMIPQELGPTSKTDLKAEYHANGELKCEKHSVVKGQTRVEQAEVREGRFPRIGQILSGIDGSKQVVLPINAHDLWRLAQAVNVPDTSDVVVLLVPAPDADGLVSEVIGVLANDESCRGEEAGGFGIIMPVHADAAQVRADFKELSEAAASSLDAAAKTWSERPGQGEEAESQPVITAAGRKPAPKRSRKPPRKRSVA